MTVSMTKWVYKAHALTLLTTLSSVAFTANAATTITNDDGSSSTVSSDSIREASRAQIFQQCFSYVPEIKPEVTDPKKAAEIKLSSKRSVVTQDDKAVFTGDVNFSQGNREMSADRATLYQQTNILTADGDIILEDTASTITGTSLVANLDTKDAEIAKVEYQLNGQPANGNARKIYITKGGDNILMQRSTYTECPKGDESWVLKASSIDIDNVDESAEAYNAVIYFQDVPIFYMPYFTYPTTKKRRSGLLFPSFESSVDNGFTYSQPFYWNIAPNYDMTIIPTYMQERGTQLTSKFRYLLGGQNGKLNVEYLADDKKTHTDRELYHWSHDGNFNDNWSLSAEYTDVSDDDYFDDLNATAGSRSDDTLLQTAALGYNTESTATELEVRDFQILNDYSETTPHRVLPKLSFEAFSDFSDSAIELSVYNEVSNFDHSNENMYSAVRSHVEPTITFPYRRSAGFAIAEFKLPMTHYSQSFNQTDNGNFTDGYEGKLEENVFRAIPTSRLHAGLNFEREAYLFDFEFTQTLEPQVQYLYIPYEDQSDIGLYDSSTIQQDFMGLYRDRIYSGLDRIADTNQITFGLTSRIFDRSGSERLRYSIGHIYHFEDTKTNVSNDPNHYVNKTNDTVIMETDFLVNRSLSFNNSIEYSRDESQIQRADAAVEYQFQKGQKVQLNYRYVEDIESILQTVNNSRNSRISQIGSKFEMPINYQWDMGASYYYDMENQVIQDALVGIKYESCCWTVRLDYSYRLKDYDINSEKKEYDKGPTLMFELKGLGGIGDDIDNIGKASVFEYGRPFQLRDD